MTLARRYYWKRFWVERGGAINLSCGGYLIDPEEEHGQILNPEVVPFEVIEQKPCVALLGEPGAGKTFALDALRSSFIESGMERSSRSIWLDLRAYANEERLCRDVFESDEFRQWINSTDTLTIYLDSLDECLVHIRTVAAFLADELKKYPTSRLRLRIACRTAEWPALLDEELGNLWGAEDFRAYEIAPLRRVDVSRAAAIRGLDSERFLREVEERNVVALAIKPITLEFLLRVFENKGCLPNTQAELYAMGCLILCREESRSRIASKAIGSLSAEERLAVAELIAGITVFCGRRTVLVGNIDQQTTEVDITVEALYTESQADARLDFSVTPEAVREVLGTGLFAGYGQDRMGWSHWTLAEFLAARFATTRGLTTSQIADLVFHPDAGERPQIVPQLQETAAWLAGMNPELSMRIAASDPQVLLRGSVGVEDPGARAELVACLLKLLEVGELTDDEIDLRRGHENLGHAGLANQLISWIEDQSKNALARRIAIEIAEVCRTVGLVGALANLALYTDEVSQIREQAAYTVMRIGDDEAKKKLRPLIDCDVDEDPDDELRGTVLSGLWPRYLTVEELFSSLTLPRRPLCSGAYASFISWGFAKHLQKEHMPTALNWVAMQAPDSGLPTDFVSLISGIMRRAWGMLDIPSVSDAFMNATISRIAHYDPILGEQPMAGANKRDLIESDPNKRRRLVEALLPRMAGRNVDPSLLVSGPSVLVSSEDLSWLIERLLGSDLAESQLSWIQLIRAAFDPRDSRQIEMALRAAEQLPGLEDALAFWFAPVLLDSPEAAAMRVHHERVERLEFKVRNAQVTRKPPAEIVRDWLDKFEAGDIGAWWLLNLAAISIPECEKHPPGGELIGDLTSLPVWELIDDGLRRRCVAAAEQYLRNADPQTTKWLGTNTSWRPADAGYRALRLLLKLRPFVLDSLSGDTWARWAPVTLSFPESPGHDGEEPMRQLVEMAYRRAPESLIEALLILIGEEDSNHGSVFVTRKLARCWDAHLANALLERVQADPPLRPGSIGDLLEVVLSHTGKAMEAAISFVVSKDIDPISRAKAVEAAVALLNTDPRPSWPSLWPILRADRTLGREVFTKLAGRAEQLHAGKIAHELTEDAVADLYLWLCQEYPHSEDVRQLGAHGVGERELIADFRDRLLAALKTGATTAAVAAIRRIAVGLPHLEWLKYVRVEAERIRLRQSWRSVSPPELLRLTAAKHVRLVENGNQLLDLVIDSLQRLEVKLQGELPAVWDLWNDDLTPKDENHLSNYVARHLSDDLLHRGVIANREVKIRPGQATDIHVDAIRQDVKSGESDRIRVIIETKGCWNDGLKMGMEDQLKARYMENNQCRHGIYLVGWFLCPKWNPEDYRRDRTPKWTLEEAREFFRTQARGISDDDTRIVSFVLNGTVD